VYLAAQTNILMSGYSCISSVRVEKPNSKFVPTPEYSGCSILGKYMLERVVFLMGLSSFVEKVGGR
jgi:hypothetical protein